MIIAVLNYLIWCIVLLMWLCYIIEYLAEKIDNKKMYSSPSRYPDNWSGYRVYNQTERTSHSEIPHIGRLFDNGVTDYIDIADTSSGDMTEETVPLGTVLLVLNLVFLGIELIDDDR